MAQTVREKPPAQREVPELPPAFAPSSLQHKSVPNWALKTAMAITGTIGASFLALHLFGNLKVFTGAAHFDAYAAGLRTFGSPILPEYFLIWCLRLVLLACIVIHVLSGATLWLRSRQARGPFKAKRNNGLRSWNATLAPITGVLIFCFVLFHLMDLTWGTKGVATSGFQHPVTTGGVITASAYENLVGSFSRAWSAIIYIVMMLLIAIHVGHGIATVAHDLGVLGRRWREALVIIAGIFAVVILLGNAAIPIYVLAGGAS